MSYPFSIIEFYLAVYFLGRAGEVTTLDSCTTHE